MVSKFIRFICYRFDGFEGLVHCAHLPCMRLSVRAYISLVLAWRLQCRRFHLWIDATTSLSSTMIKSLLSAAAMAAVGLAMPQEYTPAQLLVIRQHEAIAAANVPSVFESLPGWDQHQVTLELKSASSYSETWISL